MIFGVDIASIISETLDGQLYEVTLTRKNRGSYDPITDSYVNGGNDFVFHTDGIVENYSDETIARGMVMINDRKVLMTAKKLGTTPKVGDTLTIEGVLYGVIGIPERDPATATWTVQARVSRKEP